jgi:hypothetical protein
MSNKRRVQQSGSRALERGSDRYLRVHYDRLGLRFESWIASAPGRRAWTVILAAQQVKVVWRSGQEVGAKFISPVTRNA